MKFAIVNVQGGSIDAPDLLLFDSFEEAKGYLAEEVNMLIEDCGLDPAIAVEMFTDISASKDPGFICRNEETMVSSYILTAHPPMWIDEGIMR